MDIDMWAGAEQETRIRTHVQAVDSNGMRQWRGSEGPVPQYFIKLIKLKLIAQNILDCLKSVSEKLKFEI